MTKPLFVGGVGPNIVTVRGMRKLRMRPSSDGHTAMIRLMTKPAVPDDFDQQHKIMSMFSDNAKTYVQLGDAALALTLTFAHETLRIPKEQSIAGGWMIAMWICFLLAIITGAFYQFLSVKFLERSIDAQSYDIWNWVQPGTVYGVMLGAFYGGTIISRFMPFSDSAIPCDNVNGCRRPSFSSITMRAAKSTCVRHRFILTTAASC